MPHQIAATARISRQSQILWSCTILQQAKIESEPWPLVVYLIPNKPRTLSYTNGQNTLFTDAQERGSILKLRSSTSKYLNFYTVSEHEYRPLLNKPYWNRVSLTKKNLSLKCCQSLEQSLFLTSGQDLSKEVLWVSLGQRAAKLQAIKVGGLEKKSAAQPRP